MVPAIHTLYVDKSITVSPPRPTKPLQTLVASSQALECFVPLLCHREEPRKLRLIAHAFEQRIGSYIRI